jgi:flagellar basal-body rod protein FlgG
LSDRGFFIAATGLLSAQEQFDQISNNMANAQTPGFKKDDAVEGDFAEMLISNLADDSTTPIGRLSLGHEITGVRTDMSEGPIAQTGRQLDFALNGQGFFSVQTPQGVEYTRNGSFSRDGQGFLATTSGQRVLSDKGRPIQLPAGAISVGADGTITSNGRIVARLGVANLTAPRKAGGDMFTGTLAGRGTASVLQGSLEQSNVDEGDEMTSVMQQMRDFETSQKVLSSIDQTLQTAATEIGKVQ